MKIWIAEIASEYRNVLGDIRHWNNLSIASDGKKCWMKGFTDEQIKSIEIQSIPTIRIYELRNQLLFLPDTLVPYSKMRSALLWLPLDKAIPVELPSQNFNYFGISEKLDVKLVHSFDENEPAGILTDFDTLSQYIETVSKIRLQNLKWVVIEDEIMILGTPILPVRGKTLWQIDDHVLPAGYQFEFPLLAGSIGDKWNPDRSCYLYWNEYQGYTKIIKKDFKPLLISSFRQTFSSKK